MDTKGSGELDFVNGSVLLNFRKSANKTDKQKQNFICQKRKKSKFMFKALERKLPQFIHSLLKGLQHWVFGKIL